MTNLFFKLLIWWQHRPPGDWSVYWAEYRSYRRAFGGYWGLWGIERLLR